MTESEMRPRRWWIAMLWGLLSLSSAYLYAGLPVVALALVPLWAVLPALIALDPTGTAATPAGFYGLLLGSAGLVILLWIGAGVAAARQSDYRRRGWNLWPIYLVVAAASWAAYHSLPWLVPDRQDWAVGSFSIPASSMEPTLLVGDYIVSDQRDAALATIRRGDVVLLHHPKNPDQIYVKRVLGLPGERVRLEGGVVQIDGTALPQSEIGSYVSGETRLQRGPARLLEEAAPEGRRWRVLDWGPSGGDDFAEILLPQDGYFVLGDHRDNAMDSRFELGVVPRDAIFGVARFISFAEAFDRIGETIE